MLGHLLELFLMLRSKFLDAEVNVLFNLEGCQSGNGTDLKSDVT